MSATQAALLLINRRQGRFLFFPDPAPQIVLVDFGTSSVHWSVQVWTKAVDLGDVRQAVIRAIKLALDEAEIDIPFPQMDVHVRKEA